MKRTFKVFAPKWIYKLALTGFLISVLIPGLVCLIDDGSMVGTIVSAVLFSPFLVGALCGYRFRIIVCQDTITVRRGIGKGYSFHVNEITKVVRRVNRNTNYPFEISPPSERCCWVLLKPRKPLKIRQFIHAKAL